METPMPRLVNAGHGGCLGWPKLRQINDNGERFSSFCSFNNLDIGGPVFSYQKNPLVSPDCVTENHIDRFFIPRRCRLLLRMSRFREGQILYLARLKLRLNKHAPRIEMKMNKSRVNLLAEESLEEFQLQSRNSFQPLVDKMKDMDLESHGTKFNEGKM